MLIIESQNYEHFKLYIVLVQPVGYYPMMEPNPHGFLYHGGLICRTDTKDPGRK